jgi:hypothetical protein
LTLFKDPAAAILPRIASRPELFRNWKPALMCVHWKNQPITEKQRRKSTDGREEKLGRSSKAVSGTIVFSKKQAETLYLFFSFKRQFKFKYLKNISACTDSTDIRSPLNKLFVLLPLMASLKIGYKISV